MPPPACTTEGAGRAVRTHQARLGGRRRPRARIARRRRSRRWYARCERRRDRTCEPVHQRDGGRRCSYVRRRGERGSALFPYTTLFRSDAGSAGVRAQHGREGGRGFAQRPAGRDERSEEHTSELQSLRHVVCRLLLVQQKEQAAQFVHIRPGSEDAAVLALASPGDAEVDAGTLGVSADEIGLASQFISETAGDVVLMFGGEVSADPHSFPTRRSSDLTQARPAFVPNTGAKAAAASLNGPLAGTRDRKSTRLNSSHLGTSYAASCLYNRRSRPRSSYTSGPARRTPPSSRSHRPATPKSTLVR